MNSLNLAEKWLKKAHEILRYVETAQMQAIDQAAEIISKTIINGHVCYLFGSGHAAIPVMEMFPRYGSTLGFIPIVDIPLISFTTMVGSLGYPQFDFIENSPEYGKRILENYEIHKEDCLIAFSHSGATPITIEVAKIVKSYGTPVIAITSLAHSKAVESKHPEKLKLYEIADIVIDTGAPLGDVSIKIEELNAYVGPLSTFAFIIIANLLLLKTIEKLVIKGYKPMIFPTRRLVPKAEEYMNQILKYHRALYAKHLKL
jgi:uncharacterized phosphosugar-binding protein